MREFSLCRLLRVKYAFGLHRAQEMSGGVVALVLLILGAFNHSSCALKCYGCQSLLGDYCDDPLDKDNPNVQEISCGSNYKSCGMVKGTAWSKNIACMFCS